jgi:t-SNARE complex subunit (syntaxin)
MGWDDDDDWAELDDSEEARAQRRRAYASTRETRQRVLRLAYGILGLLLILVIILWLLS